MILICSRVQLAGLSMAVCLFCSTFVSAQEQARFFHPDGSLSSEGYMQEGRPVGYWKTYSVNGQLTSEGNRKQGQLDSIWTFYYPSGELKERITYVTGKRQGQTWSYKDGVLVQKCDYERDTLQGRCFSYAEEKIIKEVPYERGLEEGKGYEYDEEGYPRSLLYYRTGFLRRTERLNREDKLGRKQGLWRTYHSLEDKSIESEGTYVDDLKNGLFMYYDAQGKQVGLEKYENGLLQVGAEETKVVDIKNDYGKGGKILGSGAYKDGQKHGVHRRYDEEGSIVESSIYDNGTLLGTGLIDASGQYEGSWSLLYPDGSIKEEGSYTEGLREGKWVFYFPGGKKRQEGEYRQGKPNGRWQWYYEDGSLRREEYYRRGREDGESVEYDEGGEILAKGEYIDGAKEGPWFYRIGDHIIEGAYLEGEKDGEWKGTYDSGKKQYRGEYRAGYAIKKHRFYFASGQIAQEGKYNSGLREGEWVRYDTDGQPILRTIYDRGIERKLDGVRIIPTYEELGID